MASGSSPFGLASSLDGTATLIGHDGAIAGFNVEQLLKRLERRPLSGGGNLRSGSTPYDNLTVSVSSTTASPPSRTSASTDRRRA